MAYPPYPPPLAPPQPEAVIGEQPADTLPWPIWRIVNSPRWVRSSRGLDFLAWQGRIVIIVFDATTRGYRYDLGEGRSAESWPTEIAAKAAAAAAILAGPRRDKERIAAMRLLSERQERTNE